MPIINSKRNWIKWKVLCDDVIADLDVIKTWIDSMRRNRWFRVNNRDKMLLVFLPKRGDVLTNRTKSRVLRRGSDDLWPGNAFVNSRLDELKKQLRQLPQNELNVS